MDCHLKRRVSWRALGLCLAHCWVHYQLWELVPLVDPLPIQIFNFSNQIFEIAHFQSVAPGNTLVVQMKRVYVLGQAAVSALEKQDPKFSVIGYNRIEEKSDMPPLPVVVVYP